MAKSSDLPLGITIFNDAQLKQLLENKAIDRKGVLVRSVLPRSGAAKAGIKPTIRDEEEGILWGDLIVGIDGKSIQSSQDLFDVLEKTECG